VIYVSSVEDELASISRRLRRIMFLAGHGFYQTMSNEESRIINWYFLTILKEAYKALNTIYQLRIQGVGENVDSGD
jgi:hypothetical protein